MINFNDRELKILLQRIDDFLVEASKDGQSNAAEIVDYKWWQDAILKLSILNGHRVHAVIELQNIVHELNGEYAQTSRRLARESRLLRSNARVINKSSV